MIGETQARESMREFAVGYVAAQIAIDPLEAIALAIGEHRFEFCAKRFEGGVETSRRGTDRSSWLELRESSSSGAAARAFEGEERAELQVRRDIRTVALEFLGAFVNREHVGGDYPCADYVFGRDAAIAHEVEDECRADQIDELVTSASPDHFETETMSGNCVAEAFGNRMRKVGTQKAADQIGVFDQRALLQAVDQIDLGVSGYQRELGAGKPGEASAAFAERLARWEHVLPRRDPAAPGCGLQLIAELEQAGAAVELFDAWCA